jgi:Carboxypeptidase regulatory-like domain
MKFLAESVRNLRLLARSAAFVCCLGISASLVSPHPLARAQQPAAARVVQGKVVDKGDTGLKGATVYLKDGHSLAVKSYIASDDGSYRFGQLTQNTDYELWAELNGKKSGVKNLSSFDTRTTFNINLKIDTSK